MTMFQTNSDLTYPSIISSADSPYQAGSNELVLVADGALPVTVVLPGGAEAPEDGTVVCVKNAGSAVEEIGVWGNVNDFPSGADYFSAGDQIGGYPLNVTVVTQPGEAIIVRYQRYTGGLTGVGGTWHVISRSAAPII